MDEILNTFSEIELRYQQADYIERFEIVEEARELYAKMRHVERTTLCYAYPQWALVLKPNLI